MFIYEGSGCGWSIPVVVICKTSSYKLIEISKNKTENLLDPNKKYFGMPSYCCFYHFFFFWQDEAKKSKNDNKNIIK